MRGHGNVVVASNVRLAVSRAIETEVNAKLEEAETLEADLARAKPADARGADRVWEGLKRLVQSRA
jgi:hypothetical protein